MKDFPDLLLLSIGRGRPVVPDGLPHLHIEHVASDHRLSGLYSAADVFVIPSLQEAFGQTVLEAMACGTPVVGFDAGGIPEMVKPGETGLLASCGDVAGLREAVLALLADGEARARMGASCRDRVVREHGLEVQARRYADLYRSLLGAA
jgi:glycosyltransferase involved in cell wall biosynthesis